MKQWICCIAASILCACSMVTTQQMVNAEGRQFACPSATGDGWLGSTVLLAGDSRERELCVQTNRQRGWLPLEEVGELPVRFSERDGKIFVAEVLPDFPSLKSLTPEDRLTAVDGLPVASWEDARERLFGARGTPVRLDLSGPRGPLELQLIRH